jgi:hypothetical protein
LVDERERDELGRAGDRAALTANARAWWERPGLSIWLLVGQPIDVVGFVGCRDWSPDVHAFAEQLNVDGRFRWHLAPDSKPMRLVTEQPVEVAGEEALEASQGLDTGLTFGFLTFEIGAAGGVSSSAGDGDDVQRPVELAVASSVEGGGGRVDRMRRGSVRRRPSERTGRR